MCSNRLKLLMIYTSVSKIMIESLSSCSPEPEEKKKPNLAP